MLITPQDAEAAYRQLSHLLATMPDLRAEGKKPAFSREAEQWMGRVFAAVQNAGELHDAITIKTHFVQLRQDNMREWAISQITAILHRAWAVAEVKAPASAQGSFIPAGAVFDAFAAIGKVLSSATAAVIVVDPYLDEKALTDFLPLAPDSVAIQLLADKASVKATLKPAVERWIAHGATRPLEARLAPSRSLHDRLIIVDDAKAWILTQSLNAFANRAHGSLELANPESTALKLAAYADIWKNASPI